MKYGIIDTASLDSYHTPGVTRDYRPDDRALAVALALPAVERSGQVYKRAQFTTGLTAIYNAYGFDWAFNGLKPRNDKALGYTSGTSKQNHEQGLVNHKPQLIERIGQPGKGAGQYVFLTEAGVARCKAVDAELGKVAKGLTMAAYTKAVKAAEGQAKKAAKATEAALARTGGDLSKLTDEVDEPEATQVPEATDNSTSDRPTVTPEVVAMLDEVTELDKVLDAAEAEAIKSGYEGADVTAYVDAAADDWRKANH